MRSASPSLAAFLDSNTKGLVRHLVTLTLSDSTGIRWTDHTEDVGVLRSVSITAGANDKIDFDFGGARVATIAPGTYSTPDSFFAAVKAALDAVAVPSQRVTVTAGVNDSAGWHRNGVDYSATVAPGVYTGAQLGAAIVAAMNGVTPGIFTAVWGNSSHKITIVSVPGGGAGWGPYPAATHSVWPTAGFPDGFYIGEAIGCTAQTQPIWDTHATWTVNMTESGHVTISDGLDSPFSLLFATGANAATSARDVLGFGSVDTASASTATAADYSSQAEVFTAGGTGTVPLIEVGKVTEAAGTEIGECEVTLFCGSTAQLNGTRLPLAVVNNVLDEAHVKIEQVFGTTDLNLGLGTMHLFEGVIAEASPSSTVVELSLVSGLEELNVDLPRTPLQPPCTAMLFDGQCSLNKATFTVTGSVVTASTTSITTNRGEADDYFEDGVITFTSGQNAGLERGVRTYANAAGTFTFDEPLPVAPLVGDTFSVFPGCNKQIRTCNDKFANKVHFRGFHLMPTTDAEKAGDYVRKQLKTIGKKPEDPAKREPTTRYLPIVYGRRKVPAIPIYRYYVPGNYLTAHHDLIEAVCEGPITATRAIWWSNAAAYRDSVAHYGTAVLGTRPTQTAWARASGRDPAAFTAYPGTAHLRFEALDTYYVGGDSGCEVEVDGFLAGTGDPTTGDADPASIIQDLFTDEDYGAAFAWPVVTDQGTDGNITSSYARYVARAGLWISPLIDSPRPALDWLQEILDCTNASCRWTEGKLQIVPLADQPITSGAGNYLPDVTYQYALAESDFITSPGDDPISVDRPGREEIFNVCPVEFTERTSVACIDHYDEGGNFVKGDPSQSYKTRTVEDSEPVDVARHGLRRAPPATFPMVCTDTVATQISRIRAQRSAKARNQYRFTLGWRFCRLQPLDYVTISDAKFGFADRPVRILSIERDSEKQVLQIVAEDAPPGSTTAIAHSTQSSEASPISWNDSNSIPSSLGYVATSLHGLAMSNWTMRTMPTGIWRAVAYGADKYVAVGGGANRCATSPDGITWTVRTIPGTDPYYAITWNGSLFVAVGGGAAALCATSPDGITWTSRTLPSAGQWSGVAWNGITFVAVAPGPFIATSPTGTTWTTRYAASASNQFYAVTWNGSVFAAVGSNGGTGKAGVETSPDGITWTDRSTNAGPGGGFKAVAFGGNGLVAVGYEGCGRSLDGTSWTYATLPASAGGLARVADGIVWTGAAYTAIENTIGSSSAVVYLSSDGLTWTAVTVNIPNPTDGWRGICFNGKNAVMVGENAAATSLSI